MGVVRPRLVSSQAMLKMVTNSTAVKQAAKTEEGRISLAGKLSSPDYLMMSQKTRHCVKSAL